jgi:imidazolonepropionase-like amidohydrolase
MDSLTGSAFVIANGTLIDGTGAKPRPNGAIVLRGDAIAEVHSVKPPGFDPRATMIDATGKFILPGLIDGHVHLSMYQGASAGITNPTSAEFCTLRAAEHLLPILRAGVTSVSVPGGKWFVDVTLRDAVNAGMLPGPRIFCAGRALTPPGGIFDNRVTADDDDFAGSVDYCGAGIKPRALLSMDLCDGLAVHDDRPVGPRLRGETGKTELCQDRRQKARRADVEVHRVAVKQHH